MQISAVDLVLRVAAKSVGASETPANTNAGPYVERVLQRVGLTRGSPWCAAEVADTGAIALGAKWPLPLTGSCQALFDWATKAGAVQETPARGDVFLIWHPELARFAHTGFVVRIRPDGMIETVEGNTSGAGVREGWIVAARAGANPRRFRPEDRFIRWAPLVEAAA